tara:strand:+ start:989 stop:1726 length:738 start_codon:yes stop_codon:yes gene_type:complete
MKEKSVLILGASSGIGRALASEYAANGYDLMLTTRNPETLYGLKSHLQLEYKCEVQVETLDIGHSLEPANFSNLLKRLPLGVISCIGDLSDEVACSLNSKVLSTNFRVNAEGPIIFLEFFANKFADRGFGFIVAISSVAGDRGRATNGFYGSAKAMLSTYLSALRNRMFSLNVCVMDVRPGFVRTRMTAHLDLPKLLTADPVCVARDIFKGQQRRKDILYTPYYWNWIMLIIRHIPEFLFKRMKI